MNVAKLRSILIKLSLCESIHRSPVTIGQLSEKTKIPYSTLRRFLTTAENSNLVDCELQPYKSTGRRVFWLNEQGVEWLASWIELGL